MAHTRAHTRRRARRGGAPRQEAASTVAIIADAAGFALMRRYRSFRFPDHDAYLRHTEAVLRSLAERQGYTSVALFDPVGFADWCQRQRLDPDSAASRARYAGEIAVHGAAVPYRGQPLRRLVPLLMAEQDRWETWERGTDLLAGAGICPECRAVMAHCAFHRATRALRMMLRLAGPGEHHVVCSLSADSGPLTAATRAWLGEDGALRLTEPDALALCTVLAAGIARGDAAGLVLRSTAPGREPERLRGWSLRQGVLRPLSEAEVFAAYCTDARTGEPVPPEHGVVYRAAPELPPVACDGAPPPRQE